MALLALDVAPGVKFVTVTTVIGVSNQDFLALQANKLTRMAAGYIWNEVKTASDRLLEMEPAGRG